MGELAPILENNYYVKHTFRIEFQEGNYFEPVEFLSQILAGKARFVGVFPAYVGIVLETKASSKYINPRKMSNQLSES